MAELGVADRVADICGIRNIGAVQTPSEAHRRASGHGDAEDRGAALSHSLARGLSENSRRSKLERHAVSAARGNRNHVGQPGRKRCLARTVVAPRHYGSVRLHRQSVCRAGSNLYRGDQWRRSAAKCRISPSDDRSIISQSNTEVRSCGNGNNTTEGGGYGRFAESVLSPGHNKTVAAQRQAVAAACGNSDDAE